MDINKEKLRFVLNDLKWSNLSYEDIKGSLDEYSNTKFSHTHLEWAAPNGYTNVVRLLLEDGRTDPTSSANYPLRHTKKDEIRMLLLQDERVENTIESDLKVRIGPTNSDLLFWFKDIQLIQQMRIIIKREKFLKELI